MYPVFTGALIVVFLALALLHVYWAFGGKLGLGATVPSQDGRPVFEPGAAATLAVAMALVAAAAVCALRSGWLRLGEPSWVASLGIWVIALVFAARAVGDFRFVGFFKRVRGSDFARRDTFIYSPLCASIAFMAAGVAILAP
ncbi:MAG: DUF3995 domain-containing protein [Deltaproteobacteria bacterium]|nr:DUF3995 domain-containing protein [Deltaproteobacteria bacterium]MBW2394715.1 DUF3995 domain-containing protein [Deltaproteobacteria bacterium]